MTGQVACTFGSRAFGWRTDGRPDRKSPAIDEVSEEAKNGSMLGGCCSWAGGGPLVGQAGEKGLRLPDGRDGGRAW